MRSIQYQQDVLERFIPIDLPSLVDDLTLSKLLPAEMNDDWLTFCRLYRNLLHAQSHERLQALKQHYQPFNPDRDTLPVSVENKGKALLQFKQNLFKIVNEANFERISEVDLNQALNKISPHGVRVSVDFDEFADVGLFYRGSAVLTQYHSNWKRFFLRKPYEVKIYRRLLVLLQPKNRQQWIDYFVQSKHMSYSKAANKADQALKSLSLKEQETVIFLKLFKDIPRADLEMLFPNTRVCMRRFDKVKLGVFGGGGTAGGVTATLSKFSAAIDPLSAVIAIGGLLGVLWRQIAKVFSERAKYSAILTKNLYFYSLDTNKGALTHLLDAAENEECKEAILAYFFLLSAGVSDRVALDARIEDYIKQQYAIPMDFEIEDGLRKLYQAELAVIENNHISAVPLPEAIQRLQSQWQAMANNTTVIEVYTEV